ncbi:hypothetical protein DFP93_104187 [Aneurinibacillus soli]|uniref:Uncharacterized protein n=1 Tax=Aneurinibacillus soli TaxID=1500254 RepID=A0A0U4WEA4_9BACL|nr:hypothetical protein [Aneurinibacillus soli]PYE62537.1 hypothetical protein DFP93_104187 [Aneurinibacillus soli]BAU27099.1 hypothetical protein CB4_01268 [Aneurinibacillus soli]
MGFLKSLFSGAGEIVGGVVGGAIELVGEATNSDFIKEVGTGVYHATSKTGEIVGNIANGAVDVIEGVVTSNERQVENGFDEILDTAADTVSNVGKGLVHVAETSINAIENLIDGDTDAAVEAGKNLAKVAAVGIFAVGVVDLVDGADGVVSAAEIDPAEGHEVPIVENTDVQLLENPNEHHVSPHWRTLPDGTEIWVDGDGDSSVNTNGGWTQSNPDYRISK